MLDFVAHSVSEMVVQAGDAGRILERDPRRAVEAAAHIEDVGRAALTEMRRLLGVLHHGDEEAGRAPQPTLRELDRLIERSRAAGLPVTLEITGDPQPLPPGKDLAAYRVIQEALTNAIKHAGAAPTSVTVRWEPSCLQLQIVDRGGAAMNGSNGSGHGLVGMEERMRLYDGSVRAGFRMILDAEEDIDVVGESSDGAEAVAQAKRLTPDVVLMDIRMPELDGIEATRQVVAAGGDDPPRVLMLTTFDLNEYVYEAPRAGASGFLLKDVPPEELAAGIRVVARGDALLAPSITRRLIHEFARGAPAAATPPKGLDELTARELEVFRCVARGLSNAEIAS